jgi:AcrR family transcriptional regulator
MNVRVNYDADMTRSGPRQRRDARHAPTATPSEATVGKAPLTVERIVDTALDVVAAEGYDALTMRRVADALGTGAASLYAYVLNKADLDELLIGALCARVVLPQPDSRSWREQIYVVCADIRDQYLTYPGISRAAMATASTNLDTLRMAEGMLAILLAGGVHPQRAAWAIDALSLYLNAYTLELALVHQRRDHHDQHWVSDRAELTNRFRALPDAEFPHTRRHATELTSGTGHDRFDFTLHLIIDHLA